MLSRQHSVMPSRQGKPKVNSARTIDNDSEIIKELKAANRRLRQERNAALRVADEKSACTSHSADTASQQTTIARPKNLDHVKIADLREMLGLAGPEHKSEWNNLRASIASQIAGAHLDTSQTFAKQEKSRLALLFNSIERKHPALRKFAVSWVTERLCKETYNKHRYYANSKDREGSYYYRKSLERSQAPRVATASGTASNKSDTPSRESSAAANDGSNDGRSDNEQASVFDSDAVDNSDLESRDGSIAAPGELPTVD
ncbi:hypothetical protein BC834DRAFT_1031839 [Gloeopeniophorella convolvens]|nr:hypothetical protein BC834DRAFT_1031839 [Gloeopeniophorella convolvens]